MQRPQARGRASRLGLLGAALLALGLALLTGGCSTVGYYAQSVRGHLDMLHRARPVAELIADPATPAPLRARLELSQRMRDFAVSDLALPDNRSYRSYADLQRPAVVWNVVAAPELSLALKTWCFPIMGCVGYRGYFHREDAVALGDELRRQGLEVDVYGVPAYSTLGKLNWLGGDPLLNTFIDYPEIELARLIFHELGHQVAYASDDTEFNESFATSVERIGSALWVKRNGEAALAQQQQAADGRRSQFLALALDTRAKLDELYRSSVSDAEKRAGKAKLMAGMREEYERLKAGPWGGFAGYDAWFARANNATLAAMAAYNELVPQFERLFEREGRDFPRFYAEVRRLAALPKDERRATLAALR